MAHAIETEICRPTDTANAEGMADLSFVGRAMGVRTVRKMVIPRRASASLGKVDQVSHALKWFSVRAKELACISRKIREGFPLRKARADNGEQSRPS